MRTNKLSALTAATLAIFVASTLMTSAQAHAQERTVYSFTNNGTGGYGPNAGLIADAAGNFYGTTRADGPATCQSTDPTGCGTVFELAPKAGGGWKEKMLYNFHGKDGWSPDSGLTFDSAGNLYGTTAVGGTGKCAYAYGPVVGCGTVFELSPASDGKWTEKILYSFQDVDGDGAGPKSSLVFDAAGNLYGTTAGGGTYYGGTVFQLIPSAGGVWTETIIHEFGSGNDGYGQVNGLILDSAGNLYGTTYEGGAYNQGMAFELSPAAGGIWTETVLYSFQPGSTDGQNPVAGLIFDGSGNLYGTTYQGGTRGYGTVFELTNVGGVWAERLLHSFEYSDSNKDGAFPRASLILDGAGNLYGTTSNGGAYSYEGGSVFELTPAAGGDWTEKMLCSFGSKSTDGGQSYGSLIFDSTGNLYGTASQGGAYNSGAVFEVRH